jgi:IS30 family transposase
MASQLTLEEREVVAQMHFAGATQTAIGRRLGRHRTTIGRELRRNGDGATYWAVSAQQSAERRRRERPRMRKMDRPETNASVRLGLSQRWSPDQIAGRLKREFRHDRRRRVSQATVYRWIASRGDEEREHWRQFLRFGRRRPGRETRGRLPRTASIQGRPAVVDRRTRFGDWEGDTLVGGGRRGGLVTLVERRSGYLLAGKVPHLRARLVRRQLQALLAPAPPQLRRTLTLDNGKEFAEHERLSERLDLAVYFAEPYCAWQRGTNENTNGLLRQFFPKGTIFRGMHRRHLNQAQDLLNHRPRKRLGYRTPHEVLASRLTRATEM